MLLWDSPAYKHKSSQDINLGKGKNPVRHPPLLLQFRWRKWAERCEMKEVKWWGSEFSSIYLRNIKLWLIWSTHEKDRGDKKSQFVALDMLPKCLFQQAVSLPWRSALFVPSLLCIHIISWLCKCTAKPVHLKMQIKIKHRTKLVHKVFVSSVCHSTRKSLLGLGWGGQYLSMRVSKSLDSRSRWSSSFLLHPFPAQHTLAVQLTFLWDSPRLSHVIPGFVIVKFRIKL